MSMTDGITIGASVANNEWIVNASFVVYDNDLAISILKRFTEIGLEVRADRERHNLIGPKLPEDGGTKEGAAHE